MIILAIETSCDETSISVLDAKGGFKNPHFEILSNIVASQIKIHKKWGGVVPNLAKREHLKNLPIVLKKAMVKAKISAKKVDVIAVTVGPGLEPALWTGINFAKALSEVWDKPVIPVNHMEGHLLSVLLNRKQFLISNFQFPILGLLVSGGHTELVLMRDWLKYKIIGQTRDDAVGEAFDKVARMLGLPYPGGPEIAAKAAQISNSKFLISNIKLPRPMINSNDFDFSFSGLKTAVLYLIKELSEAEKTGSRRIPRYDRPQESRFLGEATVIGICREFQQAAIDVLVSKTIKAAQKYGAKTIVLGGGVAANKELRKQLRGAFAGDSKQTVNLLFPEIKFTTDNAAMIAATAYFRTLKREFVKKPNRFKANGNLSLK